MGKITVDPHVHSFYSDGSRSPKKIIGLLKRAGIKLAVLTDHDTVRGTDEFMHYADKAGILAFPGIEISAAYGGISVHVLGYKIKHKLSIVEDLMNANINERRRRLNATINNLEEFNVFKTSEREVAEFFGYNNSVLSIFHVIEYMAKKTGQDFFEVRKLFKRGGVGWVPYDNSNILSAVDAVKIIRNELGGVAVLAHPGKILKFASYNEEHIHQNAWHFLCALLSDLKEAGLRGMEVFHPSHTDQLQQALADLAKKQGFALTAGSDFHGKFKKKKSLGMSGMDVIDFLEMIG